MTARRSAARVSKVMRQVFGLAELRPGQQAIIDSVLAKRHTLAIMPTGAGKSTRRRQALIAYLRDHLSGSDIAIRVVHRLGPTHGGTDDGTFFHQPSRELEEDRAVVRSLLTRLARRDFDGVNFVELEAKAVRQWEAIDERRRAFVVQTFSVAALRAE